MVREFASGWWALPIARSTDFRSTAPDAPEVASAIRWRWAVGSAHHPLSPIVSVYPVYPVRLRVREFVSGVVGVAHRPLNGFSFNFAEADLDGDGMLNFGEFSEAVAHSDIASKLSIFF